MPGVRSAERSAVPSPDAQPGAGLRVREPSERLRAALEEHEKLMARVARRRKELEALEQAIRDASTQVRVRARPLVEEVQRLGAELHAMFEALIAAKRPQRQRERIRRLYRELQDAGVLPRRDDEECDCGSEHGESFDETPFGGAEDWTAFHPAAAPKEHNRGALRDLYRRLAETLHPDKVQDEADKAHRTEMMKEVTVAYRQSDFARLLEIERAWASSAAPTTLTADEEIERRLAVLAEADGELRKQLRALEREVRGRRRTPEADLAKTRKRGPSGVDMLLEQAEAELESLRKMHAFVEAFRDGKMSLEEFLEGPPSGGMIADDEIVDLEEAFADFVGFVEEVAATMARGRRSRGQGPRSASKRQRRRA